MRTYETTMVIDSFLKSDDIEALAKKVQNFIANHGGEIIKVEDWGKRRLAYEINRKQYGNYIHILFKAPGNIVKLLEREYRLEEAMLRYLTVKADERALAFKAQAEQEEQEQKKAAENPEGGKKDSPSEGDSEGEESQEEEEEAVEDSKAS